MVGTGDGVAGIAVAVADADVESDGEGVASALPHDAASAVPLTASARRNARRRINEG